MRIGMEEAEFEHLMQVTADSASRELGAVEPRSIEFVESVEADPYDAFEHEHARRRELPEHLGEGHRIVVLEGAPEPLRV